MPLSGDVFARRRSRPRDALLTLVSLAVAAYFVHRAVTGRYGLETREALFDRSTALEFELDSLAATRAKLARDVALLSPDAPNPDLVEEIARDVLGFAHPDDRVLIER